MTAFHHITRETGLPLAPLVAFANLSEDEITTLRDLLRELDTAES